MCFKKVNYVVCLLRNMLNVCKRNFWDPGCSTIPRILTPWSHGVARTLRTKLLALLVTRSYCNPTNSDGLHPNSILANQGRSKPLSLHNTVRILAQPSPPEVNTFAMHPLL